MLYRIVREADFLRADLFHRETAEEAREFFSAVADTSVRRGCSSVLISVHVSSALFTVEQSGFLTELAPVAGDPAHKIALVADSEELNYSHEYLELLGQRHGLNVCHFRDEAAALEWLKPVNGATLRERHGQHPDS
jgi:hypothetical protein